MSASARTARLMLLYRQSLRNAEFWMASRNHWYTEARNIRARFERNSQVQDPATIDRLLGEGEAELLRRLHPDPYIAPYTSVGLCTAGTASDVMEMDLGGGAPSDLALTVISFV
jgi:hypothetical protein